MQTFAVKLNTKGFQHIRDYFMFYISPAFYSTKVYRRTNHARECGMRCDNMIFDLFFFPSEMIGGF